MTTQLPRPGLAGVAAVEISADTISPVTAALRLHAQDRLAFILESVEGGARYGRYSMVGVRGRILSVEGEQAIMRTHDYAEIDRFPAIDPLEALRRVLPETPVTGSLPVSLASGVGYLSYEAAARFEPKLPVPEAEPHRPAPGALPPARRAHRLRPPGPDSDGLDHRRTGRTRPARRGPRDAGPALVDRGRRVRSRPRPRGTQPPAADPRYEEIVASARGARSTRARCSRPCLHGASASRARWVRSRSTARCGASTPRPHLFAIDLGPGRAVLGASPELLVRVRDGVVATRPIAGTRPRSADPVEDLALEADLLADEKELAEHAMLVDLARNDVGRVATPGSVRVASLHAIERYSHVMHIVSEVEGELAEGRDAFDAVRSTFPAGTLSGAPKVRAMQAIAELEGEQRGPYGGAIGFFAPDDVEAAITIRSMVLKDGTAFVQAGAGIVADSVPARESAEVAAKAGATLSALAEAEAIYGSEA